MYGTLRRGERAHGLLARARALGGARTVPAYELRNLGPFPALLDSGSSSIVGELYAVPLDVLRRIEMYEGASYRRGPVTLADGTRAEAFFAGPDIAHLGSAIPSGDWLSRAGT